MQDFSIYYLLATVACIALAVWLRIRLFGKLNAPDSVPAGAALMAVPADEPDSQVPGAGPAEPA